MQSPSVLVIPACILIIDDDQDRIDAMRERLRGAFREHDEILALGSTDWLNNKENVTERGPLRTVLVGRWMGWDPADVRARLEEAYPDVPFYFIENGQGGEASGLTRPDARPVNNRFQRILSELGAGWQGEEHLVEEPRDKPDWLFRGLAGESAAIQSVKNDITLVGAGDSTVLITGSVGVGKEIVARNIHFQSPRRLEAFMPVDCGISPVERLESELFGHEEGALEGADSARPGRLEMADGGTLFLDNIGDMPLPMQFKLLKMLEERVFERRGGGTPRQVNVRIVAATHRDLDTLVAQGRFREDLYYRLSVFPIHVPELRDRIDDLPVLIEEIQRKRHEDRGVRFSPAAFRALKQYAWPENLRELAALVERLSTEFPDREVDIEDLPPPYAGPGAEPPASDPKRGSEAGASRFHPDGLDLERYLADVERGLISQALAETGGATARAAALLKLQEAALLEKMHKHGLSPDVD